MATATTTTAGVFAGKWGFYPTDKDTFLKLKYLNKLAEKAKRQKASWDRWERKEPHNRVSRSRIRNSEGRKVGYQAAVPIPEPKIDNVFLTKKTYQTQSDRSGRWHPSTKFDRETVEFTGGWVYDTYRSARFPKTTEGEVKKLSYLEAIDFWYERATKK